MTVGEKYKLFNQTVTLLSSSNKSHDKINVRINKLLGKIRVSDILKLKKIS